MAPFPAAGNQIICNASRNVHGIKMNSGNTNLDARHENDEKSRWCIRASSLVCGAAFKVWYTPGAFGTRRSCSRTIGNASICKTAEVRKGNGLVRRAGRKRPIFEAESGLPDGIKMNTMNMNAFLVAWHAFGRCRLSWRRLNMRKCKSYADSRRSQIEIHKSRFTNHAQMQMQITNRDSRRPCL